ncbi:hypothetical protein GcM1_247187 [Golovinomyces cichoracearum]|uniref:Uncharacterized protein n=1 Tax=Golovinomyces cichoracearum TaxID=62708 RepID=A0A420IDV0_9PEZI|nr:hypothetical protein GcM1_247187 [Golovinomyces cichoracearum]
MRYNNWDVLLFPGLSKIPQQEFKTSCHVIQDLEAQILQPNPSLLPTVTCFIPSLDAGDSFRVSIHSWEKPEFSLHTLGLKRPPNNLFFETRLFLDGIESGSKIFSKNGPWPTVIDTSIVANKNGKFEALKFPVFHQELLSQSYWSPVDNLGRLKVIISEGFTREDAGHSFERIRNIISFSFQHAPLHLLESSSIAWPNASMWQNAIHAELKNSRTCSPKVARDIAKRNDDSQSHLLADTTFSDNTGLVQPSEVSQVRDLRADSITEPADSTFKDWHQSTVDLFMIDYLRSDSLTRSISIPHIELLSSEAGSLERMCESLMSTPAENCPQDEKVQILDADMTDPSTIMYSDFEDHDLVVGEDSLPGPDSNIFDMPTSEKAEISEHTTGTGTNNNNILTLDKEN